MKWYAGIDLGGSSLKAVALARDGSLRRSISLPIGAGISTPAQWAAVGRKPLEEFQRELGDAPQAIGLCAPGLAAKDGRSIAHLPGKLAGLEGLDWTDALGVADTIP